MNTTKSIHHLEEIKLLSCSNVKSHEITDKVHQPIRRFPHVCHADMLLPKHDKYVPRLEEDMPAVKTVQFLKFRSS